VRGQRERRQVSHSTAVVEQNRGVFVAEAIVKAEDGRDGVADSVDA
jgi:hypothetical protein